jgi:hypothetical protein
MNGKDVWAEKLRRSAKPRALPCWVSMTSQANSANDAAVIVMTKTLGIGVGDDRRRMTEAGHIAMATSPSAVQARCCGVEPWAGSGLTATQMLANPATTISRAANVPTRRKPAAVTR